MQKIHAAWPTVAYPVNHLTDAYRLWAIFDLVQIRLKGFAG